MWKIFTNKAEQGETYCDEDQYYFRENYGDSQEEKMKKIIIIITYTDNST